MNTRRSGRGRGKGCAVCQPFRHDATPERIVETGEHRHDREPIEEREIAAQDQDDLKTRQQPARDVPAQAGPESEPGHDQLDEMVPEHAELMKPVWPPMEPPAQRVRDRLSFIMVVEARQVAPARVATDFDQPGAEHDSEGQPAKQPDERRWRRPPWKRTPIQQRAKKDRQEPGFQELNLPAVGIPVLPHMNERKVERPEQRH